MPPYRTRGRPAHSDVLTPAEWRIVEAVRHGMSSREIARRRGISVDAVKFHVRNTLLKLGLSNRTELRRWTGIARTSALHRKDKVMADSPTLGTGTLGQVGQISRHVKDIAAACAWYRDALRLPHLYTFGDLAFFDCGGLRLYLQQDSKADHPESVIYFRVGDIQAAHADLAARGVEFTNAPHMIHRHEDGTEEWMAFFKDNEDRPLAIMAQVKA